MDKLKQNILSNNPRGFNFNSENRNKPRTNSDSKFSFTNDIQFDKDLFHHTSANHSDFDNPDSALNVESLCSQKKSSSCHVPITFDTNYNMKTSSNVNLPDLLFSNKMLSNQCKKQTKKGMPYDGDDRDLLSSKSESLWFDNFSDLISNNHGIFKSNTTTCQSESYLSLDKVDQTSEFHSSSCESNNFQSNYCSKRARKNINKNEDIDIETRRSDTMFSFKSLDSCKRNLETNNSEHVSPNIRTVDHSKYKKQNMPSNEHLSVNFSSDVPQGKFSSPFDAVMQYRQDIEELSEQYISKIYLEMKRKIFLKNYKYSKTFEFFSDNLKRQLKQFEKVISELKFRLSSACTLCTEEATKHCEQIKKEFLFECRLLDNYFPAYAFRDYMLSSVKVNQIIITNADSSFGFNMILPLLIRLKFPEIFVISCESCEILKMRLSKWLSNFLGKVETGLSHKKQFSNVMLCITEKQMLNYFVNDKYIFKQAVYIIFNLPLVRSIESDLVLANFQEILKLNKDSKLILLTSPYADINMYQIYFSKMKSDGVSVLKVENINLPVATIWKNDALTPLDDYVSQVVQTIFAILTLENKGDILAFLPDFTDLQRAKELLKIKLSHLYFHEIECLLLYENSSYVINYETVPDSKRTVFLASGCAESAVFPSVKFVVDCGLQRSTFYDNNLKRDVLKITFISRQRAKLRKYLASSFTSGVCYRIYNKKNYCEDMLQKDFPEILRQNPFSTLIKLFQFRVNNISKLPLIEFYPEKVICNTMEDLKKYGALKDQNVTSLGEDMSKLPFDGRYSKLILLGIEQGFAFEAIVLVAFFCNSQNIFLHSNNERHQQLIDAVKLQLTLNDSDTFTFLNVYKDWMDVDFSSEWCKNHHININVLKNVQLCVSEICGIIKDCLGENIHQGFSNLQNCCLDFTEILLECFHHDLCVFSGHSKSGYRILSTSSIGFVHPTSVIYQMKDPPQFILYDHIVCNGENTLIHITAVSSDLIMKALSNNMLHFDYYNLFEKTLICRVIEPVGQELMNEILLGVDGKKFKFIEEQIRKDSGSNFIFIDLSVDKGRVFIYALPDHIDFAQCALEDNLKCKFDSILHEHCTDILEIKYERNKVYFEINWSKGAASITLISRSQNESQNTYKQDFIDEDILDSVNIAPYLPYQLCLAWIRRPSSGEAYVTYKDETNFMSARKLALKYLMIFGHEIFIQVSSKKANQLYITGLPPETNIAHLIKELQLLSPNSEISAVELKYVPPFETSDSYLLKLKSMITDVCKEFILEEYDVIIPKPNPKDLDMMVFINSQEKEALNMIADILSVDIVKNKKFITKIIYTLVIKCNKDVCKILRSVFISELKQMEQNLKTYSEDKTGYEIGFSTDLESEEKALIKISCNNIEILSLIQRKINDLLEGEIVCNRNIKNLENIFFHGGRVWLSNLAEAENVHIVINNKTKTLILYGSQKACDNVKYQIGMFLENTGNNVIKTIPLNIVQNSSMLLKAVIREYGVNLERFIELCGLHTALLDIKAHKMLIHGSVQNVEKAEECIKILSDKLDISIPNVEQSQEICPVCACPAYNLTFRLEHCGHLYCLECIQALVEQAQFPIHCCAENCSKDIVPKDLKKILNDDCTKIKSLLEKSMKDYLEKNREHVLFCPAPDCQMFFFKADISGSKLQCPLCKNEICSKCNVLYHQGYTCDMYQNSKNDPDYSFKVWQKGAVKCKQCPRCKTAIEKVSGCNRMRCSSCHGNFCWICLAEFPTEQQVYDHIHAKHRGMLFV
ncbi:ATP-dependent RNA helicase DEAH12, chloroplastic [Trichonephila clavata]|uniref:ATP-dependent RNA helicase DEAH12, chloroplastic n=1 Tax=Trichonephila clavata TaxID=2740835 RepID=A0A8X6KAI8_TRICU|nr:ATP-dependent RNA helicase DEAH12, chloroplastic [Trichonephila clavata]